MYTYTTPDQKYRNAKYILPFVIGFFFLLSAGQIIGQFVKVDQLDKVTGKISELQTRIRSYSKQSSGHRPNYVLAIIVNGKNYDVEDTAARSKLSRLLHVDDEVTIYYPSVLYKILCSGFVHSVNQVELGNEVVYSFNEQKKQAYLLIIGFAIAGCIFGAVRYYMLNAYN
ncbi:MAG: hypothetical protein ABIN91_24475 [Mucilaginibacter sp.]|uniref:hypothetical protein n=1 Tax=Mucilaginibacter sp. TaxID=1882438 RepID=UPI0032635ADE